MKEINLVKELLLPEITGRKIRLRKRITVEKSVVRQFVVQLEIERGETFEPVVRIDAYHGFVHKDEFFPNRPKSRTRLNVGNLKAASKYAEEDIIGNLETYVRRWA